MVLVVGAAIVRQGRVLAARRTRPEALAGGWELPGGKVEPGEDATTTVVREVAEELGCAIAVTGWLDGEVPVGQDHVLRVAVASITEGEPAPREGEHDAVRWLLPDQLGEVGWLEPDRPFLPELRRVLESLERTGRRSSQRG